MGQGESLQQGMTKPSSEPKIQVSQVVGKPAPATPEKLPFPSSILSQRILDLRSTPTKSSRSSLQMNLNLVNSCVEATYAEAQGAACLTRVSVDNWQKFPSLLYTVSSDGSQTEHETELETELDTNSETEEAAMPTSMAL